MSIVSVVLPIHNVEEYLGEALESLANQTHRDIEVVMVDDGSTDRSAEIAASFAEQDSRFRLVTQDNHGLGHARNTGLRHVTGDYIAFVDSDDIVPHYAYRMIVTTLEQTGSDFLSGNEYRFDYRGAQRTSMLESGFALTRLKTNVTERRELLRDLLPHNKIYRRSFWDAAQLSFPEGILFEDGPVSVKAHALATSVDVIATPMYYWRLRDGASRSLSQLEDDPRFFVDRITASTISADFLVEHRPDLIDDFFTWDIRHKFTVMFKALPNAPATVQQMFMDAAAPHLARVPASVVKGLPPWLRARVEPTRARDLPALLNVLPKPKSADDRAVSTASVTGPRQPSLARTARRLLGRSHTLRALRGYAQVSPASASVTSAIDDLRRVGDDLVIKGIAFIPGLPADGGLTARNRVMWARHDGSRRLARLRLRVTESELAATLTSNAQFRYSRAGFEARLPLRLLRTPDGGWRYGKWILALGAATIRGIARSGLRWGSDTRGFDLTPIALDQDTWLVPTVTNGVLGFRIDRADVSLISCELRGRTLHVTGRLSKDISDDATVGVGRVMGIAEVSVPVERLPDGHTFRAAIDLSTVVDACVPLARVPIAGYPDRLFVFLRPRPGDLSPHPLVCAPDFDGFSTLVDDHRAVVQATGDGWLAVTVRRDDPMLESASWSEDGELLLRGRGADVVDRIDLVGRHSTLRQQRLLPAIVHADGSWESRFHPERVAQPGGMAALRSGSWFLVLRMRTPGGGHIDVDLPYAPELFGVNRTIAYRDRYAIKPNDLDGVALRVESRLGPTERGGYHDRRLREQYYPALRRTQPLRNVVLYDSFDGRQYSDSPRAVHEELLRRGTPLEHVWVTRDGQAPVPPGTRTVEVNSREHFMLVASSRYIVGNTHFQPWMRRREGQVVAQTWHGIGFKRVAFDMDAVHFASKGAYLEYLVEEAKHWSFLVSPSAFCTEIMRRAFRYQGEIAEIGSPRNDVLFTVKQEEAAAAVRADLGIAPDRKLLLYAPTWRDNEFYGPGRYKFTMQLDVDRLPEWVRREYALLVRRHPNTVDDLLGYDSDFIHDVANFPDARDLLAAADVLITDYSTIALDFLNTGRPILFYTYDLENYRDNLRGFYFDLEKEGPGPVLQTTAEVVDALGSLDDVAADYQKRYQRFQETYCHAEDGHATERLVDRLLRDA